MNEKMKYKLFSYTVGEWLDTLKPNQTPDRILIGDVKRLFEMLKKEGLI